MGVLRSLGRPASYFLWEKLEQTHVSDLQQADDVALVSWSLWDVEGVYQRKFACLHLCRSSDNHHKVRDRKAIRYSMVLQQRHELGGTLVVDVSNWHLTRYQQLCTTTTDGKPEDFPLCLWTRDTWKLERVVFGGVWWCLVAFGGVWRCCGAWWCLVVFVGVWRRLLVFGGVGGLVHGVWLRLVRLVVFGGVWHDSHVNTQSKQETRKQYSTSEHRIPGVLIAPHERRP
jgi:hypothetical protein